MEKKVDVVVIGAGIAGISAAIYLKRSSLSFLLLDKGMVGGKLNYIHKIDNYPGFSSISGIELSLSLQKQMQQLNIEVTYGEVNKVERKSDNFLIRTDVDTYESKAIILSSGSSEQRLGVKGEKEFFGKGVSYCATCDGPFFKNKEVAVYGYKDFAFEDALYLSSICSKVYFILPKESKASEAHYNEVISKDNIELIQGYKLKEIKGEQFVSSILVADENEEKELRVSAIFPLFEQISSIQFLSSLNVDNRNGFVLIDSSNSTNVPGLFACGDVVSKKVKQLVNAASEGALSAINAINYVRTNKK